MTTNYYIGIDLGTSAVKLLLMNAKGEVVDIVAKEYPIYYPKHGYSEQDPNDWLQAVVCGIKELIKGVDSNLLKGISIAGQMHGLVILDEHDEVIRNAILWNDNRSTKQVSYLNEKIGKNIISNYTGNIAFAGFSAPKILWLKENEPKNFAKIKKIMLPKDYIIYKLSGEFATDVSDVSGMLLFDVKNRCYSKEMLDICSINESLLPKVYESYEKVGEIKDSIKEELGIKGNVIIAAGAGDNAAAAIGTGTVGENKCNISLGTSGTVFISSGEFRVDSFNSLHSFLHADGKYHLLGCILSAASCNKWWMDDILKTNEYEKEQKDINILAGNEVFFLPYLMGERSPHNDSNIRGAFLGLSMDTSREVMTKAVLEGVCFAIRDSIEVAKSLGIRLNTARICGGGAKSILWKNLLSNIIDLTLETIEVEEGPAYGAAILAAVANKEYDSVKEAVSYIIKLKEVIKPDKALVLEYNKKYEKFKKIYPALRGVLD